MWSRTARSDRAVDLGSEAGIPRYSRGEAAGSRARILNQEGIHRSSLDCLFLTQLSVNKNHALSRPICVRPSPGRSLVSDENFTSPTKFWDRCRLCRGGTANGNKSPSRGRTKFVCIFPDGGKRKMGYDEPTSKHQCTADSTTSKAGPPTPWLRVVLFAVLALA